MKKILAIFVLSVSLLVGGIVLIDIKKTVPQSDVSKKEKKSMFKETNDPIMLEDNFQSGLEKWKIAINDSENCTNLDTDTISQRVHVVDGNTHFIIPLNLYNPPQTLDYRFLPCILQSLLLSQLNFLPFQV